MDPLSITVSCITLVGAIGKSSFAITGFVREVRGARSELDSVSRELLSLKTVLELLADDASDHTSATLPEGLRKQISGIINNCGVVVGEIEKILVHHEGNRISRAAFWAMDGKNDMAKLRSSLEAHKSALEIALDMVTLTIAREIKTDTEEIRNDTTAIREDTAQILAEIARLQQQLPQDPNRQNGTGYVLERYLDNLTTYAESVCDTAVDYDRDVRTPRLSLDEEQKRQTSHLGGHYENWQEYRGTSRVETPLRHAVSLGATSSRPRAPRPVVDQPRSSHSTPGRTARRLEVIPAARAPPIYDQNCYDREIEVPQHTLPPTRHYLPGIGEHYIYPAQVQIPEPRQQWIPPPLPVSNPPYAPVKIWQGPMTLDIPVPSRLSWPVHPDLPPAVVHANEYNHVRYSALNCPPHDAFQRSFSLRPSLFASKRQIEIMVSVNLIADAPGPISKQATTLAQTLDSIIHFVRIQNGIRNSAWLWGIDSWKKIVVVITSKYPVSPTTRYVLHEMGIVQEWNEIRESAAPGTSLESFEDFPTIIDEDSVQAHLFEFTTQMKPTCYEPTTNENFHTIPSMADVQMVACLPADPKTLLFTPHAISWMSWTEAIAQHLKPCVCIQVTAGTQVTPQQMYKHWEEAPNSSTGTTSMVVYKETLLASIRSLWKR